MDSIKIKANAKINLALAVKNKRNDGYHEVEVIYQEIDYYDTLNIAKSEKIEMFTDSSLLKNEATNLCIIAAKLLKEEFKIPGLSIRLDKKLPIGAGLGGGSSDAAAILKNGLKLYGITYSTDRLLNIAAKIGADVPFFLIGGTAYGTGKGEILKALKINEKYFILLVVPEVRVSTQWAYKNLNLALTRKYDGYKFKGFELQNLSVKNFRSEFYNDFEDLVFKRFPNLSFLKEELYNHGAVFASLSGSGSALYGLYLSKSSAEKAKKILSHRFRCQLCRPVTEE